MGEKNRYVSVTCISVEKKRKEKKRKRGEKDGEDKGNWEIERQKDEESEPNKTTDVSFDVQMSASSDKNRAKGGKDVSVEAGTGGGRRWAALRPRLIVEVEIPIRTATPRKEKKVMATPYMGGFEVPSLLPSLIRLLFAPSSWSTFGLFSPRPSRLPQSSSRRRPFRFGHFPGQRHHLRLSFPSVALQAIPD